MQVDLSNLPDGLVKKPYTIAGEECFLVFPLKDFYNWTKDTLIFRSSLWTADGRPVSLGFHKFFNMGESKLSYNPFSTKGLNVVEKLDGCLDGSTEIITIEGNKTIQEICEKNWRGKVLGYNHEDKKEVWSQIEQTSVLESDGIWYELELEDGSKIRLTGNHQVWLPILQCYRRVDELVGNEEFLLLKS